MNNKLSGKTIWVIGASSGIGRALTEELSKKETKLIISARSIDKLKTIAGSNPNIKILPLDLTASSELSSKTEEAAAIYGQIDIVIFSSGISQRTSACETPIANTRLIMETNFFSTVTITNSLLPIMKKNNGGRFVIISSLMGKFGAQKRCAYAASKHALHGYFDSLRAEEWQHNIRVTLAVPGYINTEFSINALTANGNAYGKIDPGQQTGMSTTECAKKIINAIRKDKEEFLIGGREIFGALLKRYCPGLLSKILRNKDIS